MAMQQFIIDTPAGTARIRWADYGTANEWFCRLAALTSPSRLRELDRAGWRDQSRALSDALAAASGAYRALTLPPIADPVYAIEWRDAFQSRSAVARANAALVRMGETGLSTLVDAYAEPSLAQPNSGYTILQPWAWLDSAARPTSWPVSGEGDADNPRRDFDGLGTGCGRVGALEQGCDPFDWSVISWSGPVVVARGYTVLAPPRWTMEALQRIAASGVRRGARQVLLDATASISLQNAAVLARYRVRNMGELTSQVLSTQARWEPDLAVRGLQAGLTLAAAAFNAIPVYGQVASLIIGAFAGILELANADPNAGYAMPYLVNGYLPGSAPEDGRLVSAPPDPPAPPAGQSATCAVPIIEPRVIATMGPDGTLALSLMGAPEGSWRRATFEVIGADRTVRSTPASYPSTTAEMPGLVPTQGYFARAVVTRPSGDMVSTEVITTAPVAAPLDGADLLQRLAMSCPAWLALNRSQQLDALRGMGELADADARQRAQTAISAHCFGEVMASGVDIPAPPTAPMSPRTPLDPGLFGGGTTIGGGATRVEATPGATPAPIAGRAPPPPSGAYAPGEPAGTTLGRTGLDAAGWRRLSVSDREAALERVGVPADARGTVRAAIDALTEPAGMSTGTKVALGIGAAAAVAGTYLATRR